MRHLFLRAAALALLGAWAQADPPAPLSPELAVELGRPAFVVFERPSPTGAAVTIPARSSAPDIVGTAPGATWRSGETLAFLEIVPRARGVADVRLAGSAQACRVTVQDRLEGPAVQILSPADGAAAWGEIALVGRTWSSTRRMTWTLDGAPYHQARPGTRTSQGPLDASALRGPHTIELVVEDEHGKLGRATARIHCGPPDPASTVTREAEAWAATWEVAGYPPVAPSVGPSPGASGGQVAGLYSTSQMLQVALEVPRDGWYQLLVAARAEPYLVLPALALVHDQNLYAPLAAGPVPTADRLARTPIGAPFHLAQGTQRLSIVYYNDAVDQATERDRNVFVDTVELRALGPDRPDATPPRVALYAPADARALAGTAQVFAIATDDTAVTSVGLEVDGNPVAMNAGAALRHQLDGDALAVGPHQLVALATDRAGNVGRSRPVTFTRLPYHGSAPETHVRLAADGRCETRKITAEYAAPGLATWDLYSGDDLVRFDVHVRRQGDYEIRLFARGQWFEGPAEAGIHVSAPAGRELGFARIRVMNGHYAPTAAARIPLALGPNHIAIRLANDLHAGPDRDRNLFLAGFELRQADADHAPPWCELVYPPDGAHLRGTELVVARSSDNDRVERVELLLDGQPISQSGRGGVTGLWLHARAGTSGPHRIQARAYDRAGHAFTSAARTIHWQPITADSPLSTTEDGIHLLERAGLGFRRESLAELLLVGRSAWLTAQLAAPPEDDELATLLDEILSQGNVFDHGTTRRAVLARRLTSEQPLRERMTLFFDNHFSTWIGKTGPLYEWPENRRFRELALSRFGAVLRASATSPAMLHYLDNTANRRGATNENYARELLELHTLGVQAGYTQRDVEAVARVLTGSTATLGWPIYEWIPDASGHDPRPTRVLGHELAGDLDAELPRLLALLEAHPATGRFVARKLCAMLVGDDPPAALVERVADRFRRSGGAIPDVVGAIVESPEFRDRARFGTALKTPAELVTSLARQGLTGGLDLQSLEYALNQLGQPLFGCPSPDGYPELDQDALDSGRLLTRWNLAESVSWRLELVALLGPVDTPRDRSTAIDELAMGLLGRNLGKESMAAVLAALRPDHDADRPFQNEYELRAAAALILQMPEAQRQ